MQISKCITKPNEEVPLQRQKPNGINRRRSGFSDWDFHGSTNEEIFKLSFGGWTDVESQKGWRKGTCCCNILSQTYGLKQHKFIISKDEKSRWAWLLSLLWVLQDQNQGVARAAFISGGSGDELTSKLFQAVGQTQFRVVVQLRSPFSIGCQPENSLSPLHCLYFFFFF